MELFDYQKKAVDFIKEKSKVYLALDMGMGKTLTSLASQVGRNIILVAEKNEIVNNQNFKKEIDTYFPSMRYFNLREETPEGDIDFVAGINPDGLDKLPESVIERTQALIIDEATLAKTTSTARFKRVQKIAKTVDHLVLLSGTPMMNGASELYAPLILMDNPLVAGKGAKGRKAFEAVFAGGHYRQVRNTGKWFQDYVWWNKGANYVRELRFLLQDNFFILSKAETDVFKKKTRTMVKVEMTIEWLAEYTQAWNTYLIDAKKRKVDLDNVTELRSLIENGQCYQINSRWKAKRVAKDIADGVYGSKRIVVFSMFIETDILLQEELKKLGVSFRPFEEQQEWKAGDEQVLVGRIKAHAKGGNLPQASVCLFVDMDFVPSNNIQAENRIDRPEQKEDMLIVYYMTAGDDVVDAHVRKINQDKARKIEAFMKPLTQEEIDDMPNRFRIMRSKHAKDMAVLGI